MDLALLLLYVAITLVGLFPFHGIPVLNVALGFPIGAAIANRGMRRRARPASTATLTGDPPDDPVLARAGDPPDDPVLAGAGNPPDDPVLAGAGDPPGGPGTDPRHVMRSVLYGSFATAGVTLLVCWIQLVLTILLLRIVGLASPLVDWLPLLPSPLHPNLFRAQLFAVILAPGLMVLTTVFGGVLTLILHPTTDF